MYGTATGTKRDFEMAIGPYSEQQQQQAPPNSYPTNGGAPSYYYPQHMGQAPSQMGVPPQMPMFNPQQMGMPPMNMAGFDPRSMQFLPPQFYAAAAAAAPASDAAKAVPKTDADWALEKRRARNRITAAESRRKCKEEIQNLRDELVRLKEEKQEKEDLIEYYRNRYEKFETGNEEATKEQTDSVASALVGLKKSESPTAVSAAPAIPAPEENACSVAPESVTEDDENDGDDDGN